MKNLRDDSSNFAYLRKRARHTYLTSLVSMALVLFFLGCFATAAFFGQRFANYAREAIVMKIFLHDGLNDSQRNAFIDELKAEHYVRALTYVSKEEAGQIMLQRTGEDILELMDGFNPLLASVNVQLEAAYIHVDSLARIKRKLEEEVVVSEVDYPVELITAVVQNLRMLTFAFSFLGLLLVGIVLYLVFGTIRLSIYAQRLTIRSMQLIGATHAFIRRPFLRNGLIQGGSAGLLAGLILLATLWVLQYRLETLGLEQRFFGSVQLVELLGGIVLFGLLLGLAGSYLAVNRYLNKNLDELM